MKEEIQRFISQELLSGQHQVGFDDDLLLQGFLDSVGVMRLVEHIEQACSIKVPPADITIEHFGTINAMGDYLQGRAETST